MNRAWSLSATADSHCLAVSPHTLALIVLTPEPYHSINDATVSIQIGFDEGTVVLKIGTDKPIMSMDKSGKTVWCVNNDILTASVKGLKAPDGEVVPLSPRELGQADIYPTSLSHNSNGRFIAMVGEGEYMVSTSMKLRSKCYGQCQEFVWSSSSNSDFALLTRESTICTFKNFKEHKTVKSIGIQKLFGGALLGVADNSSVRFYDWNTCTLVRQIDVLPKAGEWMRYL